jgi:putative transcription antitermination factor YqgF
MADALFQADNLSPEDCEKIAASLGLSLDQYRACVKSAATDARIDDQMKRVRAAGLGGLPTVWIGSEVIVGLPTSLSGREGTAAAGAREFAADLAGRLAPVPVRLVDERFTTTEAHDALRRGGKDARARRQVVDAAAAAVLLQAALNAERATGRPPGQLVRAGDGAGA